MNNNFKLYDEICETGLKWLLWHVEEGHNPICLTDIDIHDKGDLWFLSTVAWVTAITDVQIYFKGNPFNFLYLKWFKKYKFLHYTLRGFDMYTISVPDFEMELVHVFNRFITILDDIYTAYYER